MQPKKVLFVCIHNSARSQMAEAFLNNLAGESFIAESAGLEPGTLNPIAVDVMKEVGIDISGNKTKSVDECLNAGKRYDYVVTVCDEGNAARCPVFAGPAVKIHWSFNDPASVQGSADEKLQAVRRIRDEIRTNIERWLVAFDKG
ncbi:MAG: arsenate reductase ArsC [Candidatus Magnetoovum sp. WYHC-5]|nr:arsenate reductase ArsC [Candidatus Magnetoovum sp. WYHC-5]